MTGERLFLHATKAIGPEQKLLEVQGLSKKNNFKDVNFIVHRMLELLVFWVQENRIGSCSIWHESGR